MSTWTASSESKKKEHVTKKGTHLPITDIKGKDYFASGMAPCLVSRGTPDMGN